MQPQRHPLSKVALTKYLLSLLALGILLAGALYFLRPGLFEPVRVAYERTAFVVDPSASRAFSYGEEHFDANDPSAYNIDLAEYFFQQAVLLDPRLPYVYHELARISFLHGDFPKAMAQINYQIEEYGDSDPNAYYVRGLIEGFEGQYSASAADYEHFLKFDPHDWAAINDYSWVLLKAGRARDAVVATAYGLKYSPGNPWLLNTNAIALYEIGLITPARDQAHLALIASASLTQAQWLHAYPGNDPKVAAQGIAAFQSATIENMHTIVLASATSTLQ